MNKEMTCQQKEIDVCLILEGTYPYVTGGVSSWAHQLILNQPHLNFSLICILAAGAKTNTKYSIPENVLEVHHLYLALPKNQKKTRGSFWGKKKDTEFQSLFGTLYRAFKNIMEGKNSLGDLTEIIGALDGLNFPITPEFLIESDYAWAFLEKFYYEENYQHVSFLNFYWTWRGILISFYAVLFMALPKAKIYHSLCTGYAGLLLSIAHIKTGKPTLLTEHGIYTNERRIELATAEWLKDKDNVNLNIFDHSRKEIKMLWLNFFSALSHYVYTSSNEIITLYYGNFILQLEDGAHIDKLSVISNGIDLERFKNIKKEAGPPTIALIGRVVPIKDIKTFIHTVKIISEHIPNLRAWVMGPTEEDTEYYEECKALVDYLNLGQVLEFTGMVSIDEYLPKIDIIMLSSLSEVQPLTVLEAGACGIVPVTTDVGACREMIEGRSGEFPALGKGGFVCDLSDAKALAEASVLLLTDPVLYQKCSKILKDRIKQHYDVTIQHKAYHDVYQKYRSVG